MFSFGIITIILEGFNTYIIRYNDRETQCAHHIDSNHPLESEIDMIYLKMLLQQLCCWRKRKNLLHSSIAMSYRYGIVSLIFSILSFSCLFTIFSFHIKYLSL